MAGRAAPRVTLAAPALACVPDLPGAARILEAGRYSVAYRAVPDKLAGEPAFLAADSRMREPGRAAA